MKKVSIVLVAMMLGYASFAQDANKLLTGYNGIKDALVNGNSQAASEAVTVLQQAVQAEAAFTQKPELLDALDKMAKASGIEKQRAALNDVSTIFWKLVKASDKINQPVYYQYCPMKKTYWVSTEKEIKNPYYGSSMLTCGKVVETKQ